MTTREGIRQTNFRSWRSGVFLATILLTGCQELGWQAPLFSRSQVETPPTFTMLYSPTPQDEAHLATLGKEAEKQLPTCQETQGCDEVHFIRALSLLEKNTDLALHHFQQVAVSQIDSPLVRSSRIWIWILNETSPSNVRSRSETHLAQGLIQTLLTKDLAIAQGSLSHQRFEDKAFVLQRQIEHDAKIKVLTEQVQALAHEVASFRNQTFAMDTLKKELNTRDKRVEELTLQLDALRRIDQELKEKSTPTRLSETISPAKDDRDSTP